MKKKYKIFSFVFIFSALALTACGKQNQEIQSPEETGQLDAVITEEDSQAAEGAAEDSQEE